MASHTGHDIDAFNRAEHTAQDWVKTVAEHLGTDDLAFAHRVLRAWLHTVRDRLGVEAAAHFAAQLPLLLRGLFYDGWIPSQMPVKFDAEQFLVTVAQEARVSIADARRTAPEVSAALRQRCSPGQLEHVLAQLPGQLRDLLTPATAAADETGAQGRTLSAAESPAAGSPAAGSPAAESAGARPDDARLARVEHDVATVADALRALLRGLEEHPSEEPQPQRLSAAAHRAHQILLNVAPAP